MLLAADVAAVPTCGPDITFSDSDLPMASLVASNDLILNMTRYEENLFRLPNATTQLMDILGGNHGGFAAYDASGRLENLGQTDDRVYSGILQYLQSHLWFLVRSALTTCLFRYQMKEFRVICFPVTLRLHFRGAMQVSPSLHALFCGRSLL